MFLGGPGQILAAGTALVAVAAQDAMVADAGEQVGATGAMVGVASEGAGGEAADVEVMAACGGGAEVTHQGSPLGAMGLDTVAVEAVGDNMSDLVRDSAGQEVLAMTCQQDRVITHQPYPARVPTDLSRATTTQIEPDLYLGRLQAKMQGGGVQQGLGA